MAAARLISGGLLRLYAALDAGRCGHLSGVLDHPTGGPSNGAEILTLYEVRHGVRSLPCDISFIGVASAAFAGGPVRSAGTGLSARMTGERRPRGGRYELDGVIANVGFSSGHRFVVGRWVQSPVGPMNDVMWAQPDGVRVLLVNRSQAGDFITAIYRFDAVQVVPLTCCMDDGVMDVTAGDLRLTMRTGRRWPIPLGRVRRTAVSRPVEGLLARLLLGVRTSGVSPTGVWEWYRADEYRRVVAANASLAGRDLGRLSRFQEPARFGFSEPPRRPSIVRVRPLLIDRSGKLGPVLSGTDEGGEIAGGMPPG